MWMAALVSDLLRFTHHTLLLDSEQTVILLPFSLYVMKFVFFPPKTVLYIHGGGMLLIIMEHLCSHLYASPCVYVLHIYFFVLNQIT